MVCALAWGACEKSRSAVSGDDIEQLKHLPGGNFAVVGGNYMKLQNFMQSSMGKMVEQFSAQATGNEGASKWTDCFAKYPQLHLVGAVGRHEGGVDVRMVFTGMTLDNVTACAKDASFKTEVDSDGKYVRISIPSTMMTLEQGYLKLDDGALLMRQSMTLSPRPALAPSTRADLEADLAAAAKGPSAADDKPLLQIANKVDRTRTFWFAGTAEGTAEASTLGDVYGTVDIESGIDLDVTVQIKEPALADRLEKGVAQIKQLADKVPADLRSAVEGLQLQRDGEKLHVTAKVTDSQLAALAKLGAMGRQR